MRQEAKRSVSNALTAFRNPIMIVAQSHAEDPTDPCLTADGILVSVQTVPKRACTRPYLYRQFNSTCHQSPAARSAQRQGSNRRAGAGADLEREREENKKIRKLVQITEVLDDQDLLLQQPRVDRI
jgi:hypothetical protein